METPEDNKDYLRTDYWDERYRREENYDWLLTYQALSPVLTPLLLPTQRILVLGAGNSSLSADLYEAGYENITNIDNVFSESYDDRSQSISTTYQLGFFPNFIYKIQF